MDKIQKTDHFTQRLTGYLRELESMFGPRDQQFLIGKIKFCVNDKLPPHAHLCPDEQTIDIFLSRHALTSTRNDLGEWQLRHETVHLIDPYFNNDYTNVLEEGLATCFQMDEALSGGTKEFFPVSSDYVKAQTIVQKYYNFHLFEAIRHARLNNVKIGDVSAEYLLKAVPRMTSEDAAYLAQRFDNSRILTPRSARAPHEKD